MKGIIGAPMYITKLFTKKLSNKIKDVPLTREVKKRLNMDTALPKNQKHLKNMQILQNIKKHIL
ncbi:hypothetical protein [Sulfurihydrogenibium subterraneum]|uniref:hypothetical protein n=1 Tax=Sulfurihydrogenibium subterraneum TaxID=171121 RepID=UPI00048F6AC7|nr:hypothetical protein [Sulfurihydrogenibium subterraneum]